ncbi:MAG TPA: intradiol ring-cleavage dioxygenase [Gemmatimonadota bacterium]|nr:intradiol ring-cleavage dioxygenase [Gemmatimonadota bacterium]
MKSDDETVGRVLTRREILTMLGATGVLWLARCSEPGSIAKSAAGEVASGCVVKPQLTAGPYFVDGALERSDIRADPATGEVSAGTPLDLRFQVSRIAEGACVPLAGAVVDVWHCDARGVYSDVEDPSFDTQGRKFLRGYQVTDADGAARFTTIYPGWYRGRAVHVHFKVRSAPEAVPGFDFTSQLFFDDELSDRVHEQEPYAANGARDRRNSGDGIFRQGGPALVLALEPADPGYAGTFDIALQDV